MFPDETVMDPNGYHVLIVEDDSPTLTGIAEWLEVAHDCRVAQASNAGEALYWLGKERFDVVVTGIGMPGMNGLELTRIIRRTYGTPVIVMTGYYRWERVRQAYANGARAFLRKPFKVQLLKDVIDLVAGKGLHYIGPREHRIRESTVGHGGS
jgi:two-component system OmpR family response regulator